MLHLDHNYLDAEAKRLSLLTKPERAAKSLRDGLRTAVAGEKWKLNAQSINDPHHTHLAKVLPVFSFIWASPMFSVAFGQGEASLSERYTDFRTSPMPSAHLTPDLKRAPESLTLEERDKLLQTQIEEEIKRITQQKQKEAILEATSDAGQAKLKAIFCVLLLMFLCSFFLLCIPGGSCSSLGAETANQFDEAAGRRKEKAGRRRELVVAVHQGFHDAPPQSCGRKDSGYQAR